MIHWRPVAGDDRSGLPAITRVGKRRTSLAAELPVLVGLALLIAFLLKSLIAQAFYIPSESMVPQLEVGDRVVVSKLAYRLHPPRRGDVLVFDAPPGLRDRTPRGRRVLPLRALLGLAEAVGLRQPSTSEYIKRVIGLPGETIEGRGGVIYVDGRELVEPYLPDGVETDDFGPVTVPEGSLWVMGDNRPRSLDSRSPQVGPIARSSVVGRAVVRAWPPGRTGFL